jgi:hypothetical protein
MPPRTVPDLLEAAASRAPSVAKPAAPVPGSRPPSFIQRLRRADTANPTAVAPTLSGRPTNFTAQLQQARLKVAERNADPAYRATVEATRHAGDTPLREPLTQLLSHTLASGKDRISGREIIWRLRLSPSQEQYERRPIARVMRSLGWVRVHYGPQDRRIWGWRLRGWNLRRVIVDLNT